MLRYSLRHCSKKLSFYFRRVQFFPSPEKKESGGEDAFLSLPNVQAVLDGVSWWRENEQVNAGLYSAAFARSMYDYVEEDLLGDTPASSYRLLERGYDCCKHGNVLGTCTALVMTLQEPQKAIQLKDDYRIVLVASADTTLAKKEEDDAFSTGSRVGVISSELAYHFSHLHHADRGGNYLLDVAYVGDCSFMVVRGGRVVYVSEEQAHSLDYPYQLGTGSRDTPKDAVRLLLPVEKGDVVAVGSDGIFDNVYPHHIAEMLWPPLEKVYREHGYISLPGSDNAGSAQGMLASFAGSRNLRTRLVDDVMAALEEGTSAVVHEARTVAKDIHCDSPYASKCIQDGALFEGGKPDDMTLLVSVIGECDDDDSGERFSSSDTVYPQPYRDWP